MGMESLPRLETVFDSSLLARMVEKRMVRRQTDNTMPYAIYNYTQNAQFEREWNSVTKGCRGLVTRLESVGAEFSPTVETVVARPWAKFFNFEEHEEVSLPHEELVVVSEKMDGSLGISVPDDSNGLRIVTRGSFGSDQALHATRVLRDRYADFVGVPGWTFLWEIIYPENRIVVDYDSLDDLILLGAVDIASGDSIPIRVAAKYWTGAVVNVHPYASLLEAVDAPNGENREGIVVHFVDSDLRVKIKQADYVALHRVLTNLSTRSVWEILAEHGSVIPLLDIVPDEFYPWVHKVSEELLDSHSRHMESTETKYSEILSMLEDSGVSLESPTFRREFAQAAKMFSHPAWLFTRLDNKDYSPNVWDAIKPPPLEYATRSNTDTA